MRQDMVRIWTIGDPEPEDHPNVVAGNDPGTGDLDEDEYVPGPWHYRWEPPNEDNGWYGGWWSVENAGDLWEWEDILRENHILTEDLTE
jgi:hypothetical protein